MYERRPDFPARDPAAVGRHGGCETQVYLWAVMIPVVNALFGEI
jgi:hypothetical protein